MYKVWFDLSKNFYDGYVVWNEAAVNVVYDKCWQNIDKYIAGFLCNPCLKIGD